MKTNITKKLTIVVTCLLVGMLLANRLTVFATDIEVPETQINETASVDETSVDNENANEMSDIDETIVTEETAVTEETTVIDETAVTEEILATEETVISEEIPATEEIATSEETPDNEGLVTENFETEAIAEEIVEATALEQELTMADNAPCYIGDVEYQSLQDAVNGANDGETIFINDSITTQNTVSIDGKNLTFASADGCTVTVEGCFNISGDCEVTFTNVILGEANIDGNAALTIQR